MQPDTRPVAIAESLLATTLSAEASIASGDWETAGHLLRRREQLLTQLERERDLSDAQAVLLEVQQAEKSLLSLMERSTRDISEELGKIASFRTRKNPFSRTAETGTVLERYG